jgi:hypothetical protein
MRAEFIHNSIKRVQLREDLRRTSNSFLQEVSRIETEKSYLLQEKWLLSLKDMTILSPKIMTQLNLKYKHTIHDLQQKAKEILDLCVPASHSNVKTKTEISTTSQILTLADKIKHDIEKRITPYESLKTCTEEQLLQLDQNLLELTTKATLLKENLLKLGEDLLKVFIS